MISPYHPITLNFFQEPLTNRSQKITALTAQSRHMAKATPITPIFIQIAKITENSTRPTIVDIKLTYMVNFTSPTARRPFDKAPDKG